MERATQAPTEKAAQPPKGKAFDFSRLQSGDVIAATGGAILLLSLFLKWFSVDAAPPASANVCGVGKESCTAFDTFHFFTVLIIPGLDLLLPAAAAAPLILVWIIIRGHQLSWPPGEVTAIVGITATALIVYNGMIDRVGEDRGFVHLSYGWYIGLVGALLMVAGAATVQMRRGGAIRRPPGTF
jgi:hypothetical protein